jgi:signal transduction histidine kinase
MSQMNDSVDGSLSARLEAVGQDISTQNGIERTIASIGSAGALQRQMIRTRRVVLRYRWLHMLLLSVFYVALEFKEHLTGPHGFNFIFHTEFWLFAAIVPIVGGLTLTLLARVEDERTRAIQDLDLKHELSLQLGSVRTWAELRRYLVRFPVQLAPFQAVSLLLYDDVREQFLLVSSWRDPHSELPLELASVDAYAFRWGESLLLLSDEHLPGTSLPEDYRVYGLPLLHGRLVVAAYLLYLPADLQLEEDAISLLNSVSPSIALAIDSLHPRGSRVIAAEAAAAEQRNISRFLHDTIVQDLGFMLLKLDELQQEDTLHDPPALQKGLAQLARAADAAYQQTRDTMSALYPYRPTDLESALLHRATIECNGGSDIVVTVASEGEAKPLPSRVQRRILAIFCEALTNSKKHARATRFNVQLLWQPDCLTLNFEDDGRGFGDGDFTPGRGFGLRVMEERSEEIGGHIAFETADRGGAVVILQVPLVEPGAE